MQWEIRKWNPLKLVLSIKVRRQVVVIAGLLTVWNGATTAADIEITTAETSQQNLNQNQSLRVQGGGSVTTNTLNTPAIVGSTTGEGGNVITLESGAAVSTSRMDDYTYDDSYAIWVDGTQTDSSVRGLAGGGPLAGDASNIIDVQSGSTLSTSGRHALAIKADNNNHIIMDGELSTTGRDSHGIYAYSNNNIDFGGALTTSGRNGIGILSHSNSAIDISGFVTTTGYSADGISLGENHSVDISGTVDTSGKFAHGMLVSNNNFVVLSGAITTVGNNSYGLKMSENNSITLSGSISTSGSYATGLYARYTGNVVHISGDISATGSDSYAIYSGVYGSAGGESSTFHFLSGASITGRLYNRDSNDDQTSYLTFGYVKDGSNQADLTAVDNTFAISLDDSITSVSSGRWDGYFAGGATALNGAENQLRNIFIGADSFDNATVPDGSDGAGNSQTVNLSSIGGAVATLNVSQSITTNGVVTVGDGSTYNLFGPHIHTGTDFIVIGNGVLDLSHGGELVNNASGGNQSISKLSVLSGTGTLSGTNALEGVTEANIAGTLEFNMASDLTIDTMNLSGTLSQRSGSTLDLTTFNVANGGAASIIGTGTGAISLGTAKVDGDLTVSRALTSTGVFTLGADDTFSLSGIHTHTGTDFTANGILSLEGGSFVNNAAGGTQSINSLHVISGNTGTMTGSATTNVTTANISGTLYSDSTLAIDNLIVEQSGIANIYDATSVSADTSANGILNIYSGGTLTTDSMAIGNSGTANIYGATSVSGGTSANGILNIYIGGTLTTDSMAIGNSGTANIHGTTSVSGGTSANGILNIYNGGTLSTDSLSISHGGSVAIKGTLDSGTTTNDGRLYVNNILNSSSLFISSSGYLLGSGNINGDVNNSGTISPGNSIGTLTVNGDFAFNSGSIYEVELRGSSNDKLIVNEKANITSSTVNVSLERKLYTGRERWTIITASEGINGKFDGLSGAPRSATLSFGLDYSATSVGIYVTRIPYQTFGETANDQAVGGALDTILPSTVNSGTDMEQFFIELDFDYTADQIREALAALNPEVYSSFVDMEFIASQEFSKDIATRMHQLRESYFHLDVITNLQGIQNITEESNGKVEQIRPSLGWNLWAQTSGSVTENGEAGGSGYEIRSGRVTLGGDNQLYEWLLVGAAMGINRSDLDYNLGSNSGDQSGMHVALYGDVNYEEFYLNCIVGYGDFNNDSERVMAVFGTTAEASFDGSSLSVQVGTGYDISFSNWQVGPAVEIGVAHVDVDSFTETGNRSSLNLNIEKQSDNHTYGRLGVKAASIYQLEAITLLPRLGLGLQHTKSDDAEIDACFTGYSDAMFTVIGTDAPENVFGGELGLTALVGNQLSLYGKLNTAFGDDYSSYGLSVGLDWRF